MDARNCISAVWYQLTRKGAWRNVFVTHNALGIFSRYSHISRRTGKPKVAYHSKTTAQKAAEAMSLKHGVHFSAYKCAWCDGWHVGKNAQNKTASVEENAVSPFVVHTNEIYENLKQLHIADLAPVYGRGVRGRTLSGRGNRHLLGKIRNAGVRVIIDLRTQDHTDRFDRNVADAGLEYFHIPVDGRNADAQGIISAMPGLLRLLDDGGFYIACAMGLHRTDIALALYYVFHPSVPYGDVPEMRGHRKDGRFRCDDIAARLNSVMRSMTTEALASLGLPPDYEQEFNRRKRMLFERNRIFQD